MADPAPEYLAAIASTPAQPATLKTLFDWTFRVIKALAAVVLLGLEDHNNDLHQLDARITHLENAAPVPPVPSSSSTQQPQPPGSRRRCQRCHALGHDTDSCRTKDPAVMKKRVAKNAKARNQPRKSAAPSFPIPSYPYSFSPYTPPPAPPPTADSLNAMIVDASELRRRATQSARDRKRFRRSQAPST
ncbi:hypothetical protein BD779DRAFT_1556563 [Infundibulicybe gibba]|nr:hypothetical protein BD779DRAFT_1606193 [Infundibulicybe gibba]KAF8869886.1 hypothetical protein BD779DRAFT_1583196 [Infundibulicybe gibba]KAF8877680.1 hypothetical protein BD779DRAFT_1556563 [Infundibulicybe gibba]